MDDRLFRDATGKFATGITIVTTEYNGEIIGMTVNAFMSVSLEPKLIAISIDENASMYNKLQETEKFGISVLAEDQQEVSMLFAKQIEVGIDPQYIMQDKVPVIKGSVSSLSCTVKDTIKAGDHMIFIAEVTKISMDEGSPILYYGGQYRTIKSS